MVRATLIAGSALSLTMFSSVLQAQTTGIAACDDFLKKYEACITGKVPAAQRPIFQGQFDQVRKAWSDMAKNASTKPSLEAACKQTGDQMKASLSSFGCTF